MGERVSKEIKFQSERRGARHTWSIRLFDGIYGLDEVAITNPSLGT